MKRSTLPALLGLLALLLLSACRETIPTAESSSAGTGSSSAAITVSGPYPAPDLTLLAAGERPQLLNFYADW